MNDASSLFWSESRFNEKCGWNPGTYLLTGAILLLASIHLLLLMFAVSFAFRCDSLLLVCSLAAACDVYTSALLEADTGRLAFLYDL